MDICASEELNKRLPQLPKCKGCEINPVNIGDYSMGHSIFCSEHCRRYFLGIYYRPIALVIEDRQKNARQVRQRRYADISNTMLVTKDEYEAIWLAMRRYKATELEDTVRVIWLWVLGYCHEVIMREMGMESRQVLDIVRKYEKVGLDEILQGMRILRIRELSGCIEGGG